MPIHNFGKGGKLNRQRKNALMVKNVMARHGAVIPSGRAFDLPLYLAAFFDEHLVEPQYVAEVDGPNNIEATAPRFISFLEWDVSRHHHRLCFAVVGDSARQPLWFRRVLPNTVDEALAVTFAKEFHDIFQIIPF